MIRVARAALGLLGSALLAGAAFANTPFIPGLEAVTGADTQANTQAVSDPALAPASPVAVALSAGLASLPADSTPQDIKENDALVAFYADRNRAPLWVTSEGLSSIARAIITEIEKANDWGLESKDFALPKLPVGDDPGSELSPEAIADAELTLARAILLYARHARGGRIMDPTTQLNSNLDRKPQLLRPLIVLKGVSDASAPDAYLRGLHPQHPQFEKLRQAYLATRSTATRDKLRANMEAWRWMPEDIGDLHILANVPEFMVYLVKDGDPIHSERIVVGETGKQTTIFTRNLKTIVFKPTWRVPESIKVKELWPSLRRGGGMFRQHGLQLETKDGRPLDYRTIDWNVADIRDYEVIQPSGRKNVMGVVKFTFPSQHTIFMHDTIDKWMFGRSQRTLSHGCLRLRDPMRMAELVLAEDKNWDKARVAEVSQTGPDSNEIVIDRKIPVHLVYFTAWVKKNGKVRFFRDVYGHEKRIRQALAGDWDEINVGKNHLAPVEPVSSSPTRVSRRRQRQPTTTNDLVGSALGGEF